MVLCSSCCSEPAVPILLTRQANRAGTWATLANCDSPWFRGHTGWERVYSCQLRLALVPWAHWVGASLLLPTATDPWFLGATLATCDSPWFGGHTLGGDVGATLLLPTPTDPWFRGHTLGGDVGASLLLPCVAHPWLGTQG